MSAAPHGDVHPLHQPVLRVQESHATMPAVPHGIVALFRVVRVRQPHGGVALFRVV